MIGGGERALTTFFLVRHGQSEGNANRILAGRRIPFHLTDKGVKQTQRLAQDFRELKIDRIYTSPLLRTVETAEIIAKSIDQDFVIDDHFVEVEIGCLVGRNVDELNEQDPDWTRELYDKKFVKYGIEKYSEISRRMFEGLESIAAKYPTGKIIIVTHLDPIRSVAASILDLKGRAIRSISILNGSTTVVKKGEKNWKLLTFNLLRLKDYFEEERIDL